LSHRQQNVAATVTAAEITLGKIVGPDNHKQHICVVAQENSLHFPPLDAQ
jgi:hypothetical protein